MKTSNENEKAPEEAWPVRPYSKRELAEAYAPNISPAVCPEPLGTMV